MLISSIALSDNNRNLPDKIAESLQDARFTRSEDYNGIIRSIGVKLTFIGTGAEYLKSVFDIYGPGAIVEISILYAVNMMDFKEIFNGKVDLKTYTYSYKNLTVDCQLINGDIEDKLINGIELKQVYTPSDAVWTSTLFRKRNRHFTATTESGASALTNVGGLGIANYTMIVPKMIKTAGSDRVINIIDWFYYEAPSGVFPKDISQPYYHFQSKATSDYNISITTNYSINGNYLLPNSSLLIIIYDKYENYKSLYNLGINHLTAGTFTDTKSYNVTLAQGDYIVLAYAVQGVFDTSIYTKFKINSFNCLFAIKEYLPDSAHATIKAFTLLNDIAEKLTGSANIVKSYLLNDYTASGRYKWTMFTSGISIRTPYMDFSTDALLLNKPFLSISLDDAIKALRVPFALGMGIEGSGKVKRVIIDSICQFYKPEQVVDLGEVREFSEEFDMTQVYNSLKMGYPDSSKEDDTDNFEFLGTSEYNTPTDFVKNALTNTTQVITDGNTIELTRQNVITDTNTESDRNDDSVFMVNCFYNSGTITTARDENITSFDTTYAPDNTILYNVELWQPMTLRHWAGWLLSGFNHSIADIINVLTAANKKFNISLLVSGNTIQLTNDGFVTLANLRKLAKAVPITNGKGAIFEPILYNFKSYFTAEQLSAFENNRHGTIKFSYLGETFYGYAMQVPAVPYIESEFVLLKLSRYARSILTII